eukprot:727577_1
MSAQTIVSTILPILGFVNGSFMALSPAKAATRIYKLDEKEVKPEIVDLVQANGASAFSVAVAEILMSFTNIDYSRAVAIGTIPRVCFLLYSMKQKSKMGSEFLEPRNLLKIVLATILIEGRWMDPTLSLQVRGGLYLVLGILCTMAPNFVATKSSQLDANPITERCLRARGKSDIIFGSLVYCLATMPYIEALGYACLAWFASSLYGDFIINTKDRFRSDAFVQLLIAGVSAGVLLTA